jgi:hypothetical protein
MESWFTILEKPLWFPFRLPKVRFAMYFVLRPMSLLALGPTVLWPSLVKNRIVKTGRLTSTK